MPPETAAAEAPPEAQPQTPAPPATESQPDPPTPAVTTAETPEGGTAQTSEQPTEIAPVKLSPETLAAIAELHADDLAANPEIRSRIEPEVKRELQGQTQRERSDYTLDTEYARISKDFEDTASQSAELLRRFQEGDLEINAPQIAQATLRTIGLATERANRSLFVSADAVAKNLLDEHAELQVGVTQDKQPLSVADVYAAVSEQYVRDANAGAKLIERANAGLTEITPEQERQIAQARSRALPQYVQAITTIAMAVGETLGEQKATKKLERYAQNREQLARDNTLAELAAQGALGGKTPGAPNGQADQRTEAQILADPNTPVNQLIEIRKRQRGA